jgi:crotonobetainyl-CoA:carnitine CoA-transferase CaiB-like acyl-CoA transferase
MAKSTKAKAAGSGGPPLPLAGIKVVEFVHMVMGPTAGLVLADLGADVIKVEPAPDGDNTRRLVGAGAGFFVYFNRNKRSLAIDMKTPEGLAAVLRLIDSADVVTENFRPGAMSKLGLGYEALAERNPRLVYCSLKGFLSGPYESRTALDEVVQMMGGLAYMTGPVGRPLRAGTSVNDIMGGMFAVIAILAALRERDRTGMGQLVTSALFENCAFLSAQHMAAEAVTGKALPPMPVRMSSWAVYDVFDTADASQLFVAIVTDTQWTAFCEEFGRGDLLVDPSLATNRQRIEARDRVIPLLAEFFEGFAKAELMGRFERIGVSYAPINRPTDLFDDPHLTASGGLLDVSLTDGRRTRLPGMPLELGGRKLALRREAPLAGEHNAEVLAEIGLTASEIEALTVKGVITPVPERRRQGGPGR